MKEKEKKEDLYKISILKLIIRGIMAISLFAMIIMLFFEYNQSDSIKTPHGIFYSSIALCSIFVFLISFGVKKEYPLRILLIFWIILVVINVIVLFLMLAPVGFYLFLFLSFPFVLILFFIWHLS